MEENRKMYRYTEDIEVTLEKIKQCIDALKQLDEVEKIKG